MLFAKGTRVRLRHSADQGVVTEILDKDLLMIRLDGDAMEIPVFTEDLERHREENTGGVKNKIVIIQPAKAEVPKPALQEVESQYAILKSVGIQLAFDPVTSGEFRLYLLNDTNLEYIYHFRFISGNKLKFDKHGKLPSVSAIELGTMLLDELNDQPEVQLKCSRITTEGLGTELFKELKIKAKQFFSKTITAPILNRPVHLYRIFDRNEPKDTTSEKEDLKTYTLRKAQPLARTNNNLRKLPHEVLELASFVPEIDLHIEKLSDNPKKLSNAEIIRIQMFHFEQFIEKALRIGAERVYIIHGLGKGRLRDSIATRLMQMDFVKTFNNGYHPRYGFGATEVTLR